MMNINEVLNVIKPITDEIKSKFNLTGEMEILESYELDYDEINDTLEGYDLEDNKLYMVNSGGFNEEDYIVNVVCSKDGKPLVVQVMDAEGYQLYIHAL